MNKTAFPLLLAAALLLVGPGLRAQTAAPVSAPVPAKPAAPNVTVTFTVLAYGANGPGLSYQTGGQYTPLRLAIATRSPAYRYTGPAEMILYGAAASNAPGTPRPEVARAVLPPNVTRVLLLVVGNGTGYSIGVLNDDGQTLPFGKARIYNASPIPVSVNYNFTTTVVLQPRESKVVDPTKDKLVAVEVSIQGPDAKWMKQVNQGWELAADARREVFILNGADFKGMGVADRSVQMYSLEEKKPKAP